MSSFSVALLCAWVTSHRFPEVFLNFTQKEHWGGLGKSLINLPSDGRSFKGLSLPVNSSSSGGGSRRYPDIYSIEQGPCLT